MDFRNIKMTEEDLEKAAERADDFVQALQSDPELMNEAVEKLGGVWDTVSEGARGLGETFNKALPLTLAAAASTAAVAGASGLASETYKTIKDSILKAKAYKAMMDEAGDRIADVPAEKVQQSFNTLYKFNPEFARDPVVAAEFVRETSRSEAYPFNLLRSVVDARGEQKQNWIDYQKFAPKLPLKNP